MQITSAFLKTFYYFSHYDQITSYRASLRHGAIGLGSLHFALDTVHGAERFSGCAFGYANHLQQQRRAQADACGDFAEADGAGARANRVVLFEAQKGMRVQVGDGLGRFAVGSFAGHRIVRKADSESRPDDDGESQTGVAAFRCGGLLDALSRESHQVGPWRKCGGDAERCFKVAVRDGEEDVCVHGQTKGDVRRESRTFHERDSGGPRRRLDSVDPQAYRGRKHRLPDFRRAGFSEGPRRKIHEDSLHELHAVCIDGSKLQTRFLHHTAREQ